VTEGLLALVATWGVVVIVGTTFLSCLALPVPASLMMLAGGAFAATGDLGLAEVAAGALLGAVAGDHVGYFAARRASGRLQRWTERRHGRRAALARAEAFLEHRGGAAVFLTRWLFSPLGPYINAAAGLARMPLARFSPWDAAGEAVWVSVYVGVGYAAVGNIETAQAAVGNALAAVAVGGAALALAVWLWRSARRG
jgi:membrane-associated protein